MVRCKKRVTAFKFKWTFNNNPLSVTLRLNQTQNITASPVTMLMLLLGTILTRRSNSLLLL